MELVFVELVKKIDELLTGVYTSGTGPATMTKMKIKDRLS